MKLFAALLLSTAAYAQAPLTVPEPVKQALEQVQPAAIKAHIACLADDRLLGRQAGTPGYQMAVDYVTQQLKTLGVQPAGEPEQNRFIRSDQYSFVTAGIPALHLKYGNKTADGRNNLSQQVQEWRAATYHKPQDDINGLFDFEAGRKYVQLCFLVGSQVAQNPVRPTWNKGDFFGQRYGVR